MFNQPLQNRLCACSKTGFVPAPKPALCQLLNRLCADTKPTAPKPALWLLLNRLCIGTKPAFSFWKNISTVSEIRCDTVMGLGLVARIEASILVFDTKPILYRPVLGQIQFCSFDRRCKTCLDTKPVLYQGRFCSLTVVQCHRNVDALKSYPNLDSEGWIEKKKGVTWQMKIRWSRIFFNNFSVKTNNCVSCDCVNCVSTEK